MDIIPYIDGYVHSYFHTPCILKLFGIYSKS
jgi:hypothetical protein